MKNSKRWIAAGAALALTVLCGGAALAAAGGQDDPLITLSYLEQTVIPDVVRQVEEKAAARQDELSKSFSDLIEQYRQADADGAGSGSESASFTLVTLTSGQTLNLDVGCELLLRIGTAKVNANSSPALIDVSTGGTVANGASLTVNHLYMSTIADRTVTPTAATVKLLVRGGYSIT